MICGPSDARWLVLAALALGACVADSGAVLDAGPDAREPITQTFEFQQPTEPGLQELINSCATGPDPASCDAMCRRVICASDADAQLNIYQCKLVRSGPIASITITYDGPVACPGIPFLLSRP